MMYLWASSLSTALATFKNKNKILLAQLKKTLKKQRREETFCSRLLVI